MPLLVYFSILDAMLLKGAKTGGRSVENGTENLGNNAWVFMGLGLRSKGKPVAATLPVAQRDRQSSM